METGEQRAGQPTDRGAAEPQGAARLGELLVREGVITEAQLRDALQSQGHRPEGYAHLGQILVDRKLVTREQLTSVLDRHRKRSRLGEILVASRVVTQEQLDFALEHQRKTGLRLGDVLVRLNYVTEQEMKQALCTQMNVSFTDLDALVLDRSLADLVSADYAHTRHVVPLARAGQTLTVAMDDPTDVATVQALAASTGCAIEVVTSTHAAFARAFDRLYKEAADAAVTTARLEFLAGDQASALTGSITFSEEVQRGEDLVRSLIAVAMRWKATDIHLEALESRTRVRFRIDGVLQDLNLGDLGDAVERGYRELISRIKILGTLNIAERRRPQDGSFRARVAEEGRLVNVNFRISVIPGYFGENVVLRLLDPRSVPIWIQHLGFSKAVTDGLLDVLGHGGGILPITGPTGSGKTTTLYALLKTLARPEIRVLTAEDPVEYIHEDFSQTEVNDKAGNTYASILRAFLHHDPEVIMVGEIRDAEAAEVAFRAAQTGHLILTTVHTNDAIGSVTRLADLRVPPSLLASTLRAVLAQRLVRLVCAGCREEYLPPEGLLEELLPGRRPEGPFHRGRGCPACNFSGYKGRVAVGELWVPSEADQSIIHRGGHFDELRTSARQSTLHMADDAAEKLFAGRTTLEELKRVGVRPYNSTTPAARP